jgi:hypothetical protein
MIKIGYALVPPLRNKNKIIRAPPPSCHREHVCSTAPHVQHRRRSPRAVWKGRHRQYATPCPHSVIKAAALHKIGHCSAIEPKINNQISPKVRVPRNDETPARLSGGGSNRNRVNENQNQEEPTGGSVFWFHDLYYALDSFLRMWCSSTSGFLLVDCPVARLQVVRLKIPELS